MTAPRLLDLFCGAGGASMGYHRAGFRVVGVDIKRQPHYPFEFIQADATTFPLDGFDVIHASPPCQAYSVTRHSQPQVKYPDLLPLTRERLAATGKPWVIENVVGAPMGWAIELCGTSFGLYATDLDGQRLRLKRHRWFEFDRLMLGPPCSCDRSIMVGGVYSGGPANRQKNTWAGSKGRRGGYTPRHQVREELMGIDWMNQHELTQAIPPAYTKWIGKQLYMDARKAA